MVEYVGRVTFIGRGWCAYNPT